MDFDSIISIILILLFFVAPSILKQVAQKKKKAEEKAPQAVTKLSLFQRLGEQIREYALNLERQARQNEQGKETGWEAFEEEPQGEFPNPFDPDRYAEETELESSPIVRAEPKRAVPKPEKIKKTRQGPCARSAFAPVQGEPSPLQLQQAIIWSEILSKPIALRDNSMI